MQFINEDLVYLKKKSYKIHKYLISDITKHILLNSCILFSTIKKNESQYFEINH